MEKAIFIKETFTRWKVNALATKDTARSILLDEMQILAILSLNRTDDKWDS